MDNQLIMKIFTAIFIALCLWIGASIHQLNVNISTVIERTLSHDHRIKMIENKIFLKGGN